MKDSGSITLKETNSFDDKRTLETSNQKVILKEWLPEDANNDKLIIDESDTHRLRSQLKEIEKEQINFEYVYCIGGDGTLLRLLRILFFRFLPPTLPKIVTLSMGSLGYLCNF